MTQYIAKRLGQTLLIVFLVSFLTFLLVAVMPKDPVYILYGTDLTPEEYEIAYKALGLDQPLLTRYVDWLAGVLRGDFGISYKHHLPVTEIIGQKIGVTLYLSLVSTCISFPLGILFGVITAVKRGKWQDTIITLIANLSASIPGFVLAVGLMYLLSVKYKLLPTSGFTFPWVDFGKHFQQIIMPMFCLSLGGVAGVCRQTRSSMLEAIRQDYVRTARSKGLEENTIISKHVLKNGLIPIVTLIGGRLAMMIGGSVFIENVFSIPGMGSLMVNSVNNFDIPVIQACVLLTSVIISLAYFITDMERLAADFSADPDEILPEPGTLETGRAYREKKAKPLLAQIVKVLRSLYLAYVELRGKFERLQGDYGRVRESNARLSDRLQEVKLENKALRQVSADYERVKRVFGPEQVEVAVQADKQREQAEKGRKRPRRSVDRGER